MIKFLKKFLTEQLEDSKKEVRRAVKSKLEDKQFYFEGKVFAYRHILSFIKKAEMKE